MKGATDHHIVLEPRITDGGRRRHLVNEDASAQGGGGAWGAGASIIKLFMIGLCLLG